MINVQKLEVMESQICQRLEKTSHIREKSDIWPPKNSEISSLLFLLYHIFLGPTTLALVVLIRPIYSWVVWNCQLKYALFVSMFFALLLLTQSFDRHFGAREAVAGNGE